MLLHGKTAMMQTQTYMHADTHTRPPLTCAWRGAITASHVMHGSTLCRVH